MLSFVKQKWYKWTERSVRLPIGTSLPLERPGTDYGGWIIPAQWLRPDSIVYLVGAGEDVSFDVAVAHQYGCNVHIVDPTPRAQTHVGQLKQHLLSGTRTALANSESGFYPEYPPAVAERLVFHPVGLWNERTHLRFYSPADPSNVSHSIVNLQHTETYIEVPVLRLAQLMAQNGHTSVDLLKIDIEGAEYTVLDTVLEDNIPVKVICIEYDESHRNHFNGQYMDRIEGSLAKLVRAGYHIAAKEKHCHNYTLVHQSLL
jgi:FkbM family methyltransferase